MSESYLLNKPVLLPVVYLGPVSYYQTLLAAPGVVLEKHEHFIKQTFRNRCFIAGPNGKQMLVIPVVKGKSGHTVIKDVRICNETPWQSIHWRSLEAGYRRSPYFEYYEDDLRGLYETKAEFLFDFNVRLQEKMLKWLKVEIPLSYSEFYEPDFQKGEDFRTEWPPFSCAQYMQVFTNRNGYIKGLSIVDLIFNEGPGSISYLKR